MKRMLPTLEDYRDLTIHEFYTKHYPSEYKTVIASLLVEKDKLLSDKTEDANKRVTKINKTLEGLHKKTLSPSAGISIGFVVQEENQAPYVVFLATDDARERGFRFSLNGTIEGSDSSWHAGRLREFQEEMLNFPFIKEMIARMPTDDSENFLNHTTDKTVLSRLKDLKFLYISRQTIFIDQSQVYQLDAIQSDLIKPLDQLMRTYSKITSDESGKNIFANFMFGKGPMTEAVPKLLESIEALLNINADITPFIDNDRENLTQLKEKLEAYENDGGNKAELCKLIENTVMKYSEAKGLQLITYSEIKELLSAPQKESGIFEPNYEMFKKLGSDLECLVGQSIRRSQQNTSSTSTANYGLSAKNIGNVDAEVKAEKLDPPKSTFTPMN